MPRRPPGRSTVAIHGNPATRTAPDPVAPPIYQSATFLRPVGSTDETLYTRYGNNPNQLRLAERLAGLEGAEAAIFVASGMGATALAHLAVLSPGDHLLSSDWIYGGTRRLFREEFTRFGIDVSFVNPDRRREWRSKLRKNTRAIFVETPTNPLMRVLDVEWLATLAETEGIALLVDSTFATPINYRPLEHGADVVIHSATKYLNGHSDVIAGAVAGAATLVDEVRERMKLWGQAIDPHAAWLVERGLKTLAVRMERHNRTGLAIASWLEEHPKVRRVHYPGLDSHPDHELAARVLDGFSGMVGVELAGGARAADRCLRALRLVAHAPSLGGVESLVSEPRFTSHAALTADERAAAGIPDGFLRLSLGLEDPDDLMDDLARGLAAA
ncbi:MAG TPA: aminotransferase class I/II-fold pyridoxal phosphate-dependent enzyme [Gemmatimonadales bacterium]|nr:aminotransferase class I/II-fold pyridoxal phosphate-dependent enzyme [Gemmatimonadales bacterium]